MDIAQPVSPDNTQCRSELVILNQHNSDAVIETIKTQTADRIQLRWLDWLFILRPTLMFPPWTMVLAGSYLTSSSGNLSVFQWIMFSVALSSVFGLIYLLNQMKDADTDRHNSKLVLAASEQFGMRKMIIEAIALCVVTITTLLLTNVFHVYVIIVVVFVVTGVLYNFTPFALKNRPLSGLFAGAVGGWLLLELGAHLTESNLNYGIAWLYILCFTAGCLITTLPDVDGDRKAGKKTFAVVYGEKATIISAGIMVFASLVGSIVFQQWEIILPTTTAIVANIISLVKGSAQPAVSGNKLAIFLLSLVIGWHFPIYILIIIAYYPLARWYHKRRLGLDYPSFTAV